MQKGNFKNEKPADVKPLLCGDSEQFYCADWNRCGAICEEQCSACKKAENMPETAQENCH